MPSPRYWREIPARYRLEGSRCTSCDKVVWPARRICPVCHGREWRPAALSRRGRVVTSTIVHVAPTDLAMETPYAMAVVETPEGTRLMVRVADCEPADVRPGTEVRLAFRRLRREGKAGILCYGYKAVPER